MDAVFLEAVRRYLDKFGEMPTPRVYSEMAGIARFMGSKATVQLILDVGMDAGRFTYR